MTDMKLRFIIIVLFAILLYCGSDANGQIRYDGTYFRMGNVQKHDKYKFNIGGYNGLYMKNGDCVFKIDMTGETPAFSGSGDRINFYNPNTGMYASLMSAGYHVVRDPAWDGFHPFSPSDDIPARLFRINAVNFNWKSSAKDGRKNSDIGMLAQDIESVFPELVKTDENGIKLVNYIGLLPLLTQTLQELNARIEQQKETIDNLLKTLEDEK